MIYILDKKEHLSNIESKGHYSLHYQWVKDLTQSSSIKEISYNLINLKYFFYLLFLQKNKKIFLPNLSLYDRNSIFLTILSLFTPFSKKIIICHTISKIYILNWIFFKNIKNSEIYVYSDALKKYINEILPKNSSTKLYLAEFPNARMMKNLVSSKDNISQKKEINIKEPLKFLCWGSPLNKIDLKKIRYLLSNYIEDLTIIGNYEILYQIKKEYPNKVTHIERANDIELANILKLSDVNIMVLKDDHDFYIKKYASSGIYMTSLMFNIPSFIWCNLDLHYDEITSDTASIIIKKKSQIDKIKDIFITKKKAVDRMYRTKINLDFLS